MSKIGINLWNWSSKPAREMEQLIDKVGALGFDAVELPMGDLDSVDWDHIRQALERNHLELTLCASLPAGSDISSFEDCQREKASQYFLRCCELGGYLGAKVLSGPIYSGGGKRHLLSEELKEKEWDLAVSGLRAIALKAAENGLKLGIEPINRYRTSMVNTAEQALCMCSDIGEENVGLLYDTYQANIEEISIADSLECVLKKNKLAHLHTCENHRGAPGSGHIDWDNIARVLKENHYTGHCTMEMFCQGGLDASWNTPEDRDQQAVNGLRFLKNLLA